MHLVSHVGPGEARVTNHTGHEEIIAFDVYVRRGSICEILGAGGRRAGRRGEGGWEGKIDGGIDMERKRRERKTDGGIGRERRGKGGREKQLEVQVERGKKYNYTQTRLYTLDRIYV